MMNIWIMEDPEKNRWSSKTLVLHSSEIHIVNKIDLRVQGTTRKGEVSLEPQQLFYAFFFMIYKRTI